MSYWLKLIRTLLTPAVVFLGLVCPVYLFAQSTAPNDILLSQSVLSQGSDLEFSSGKRRLETVTVAANDRNTTTTKWVLKQGERYWIEARGVFSVWGHREDGVDAVWCYACGGGPQPWNQLRVDGRGMIDILQAQNGPNASFPYNTKHVYRLELKGKGATLDLFIADAQRSAGDNRGELTVTLYDEDPMARQGAGRTFDDSSHSGASGPSEEVLDQFAHIPHAAISGHNAKHLRGASREECARACVEETSFLCKSFDYYNRTRACDLSDKNAADVRGLRTNRGDYDHYARVIMKPPPPSETAGQESSRFTEWLDRDDASVTGDWELLEDFQKEGQVCEKPLDIECQTLDGRDYQDTGQVYTCSKDLGGICKNIDQADGRACLDYRVRFLCPAQGAAARKSQDIPPPVEDEDVLSLTVGNQTENYSITRGAGLSGRNNKTVPNVTPMDCARACVNETSFECKSFDYNTKRTYCFLSSFNLENGGQLTRRYGTEYDYYEREVLSAALDQTPGQNKFTEWLNRDSPSASGDWEQLSDFLKKGKACEQPLDIECQTLDGRDYRDAGQVYSCARDIGGVCKHADQRDGRPCLDYRVRFLCPDSSADATIQAPGAEITWDFESGDLHGWTLSGTAFDHQPTLGDNPASRGRESAKQQGQFWIGAYEKRHSASDKPGAIQGDRPAGSMESAEFTIRQPEINFLVGGGCNLNLVYVELLIAGQSVHKATGKCSETLVRVHWDVGRYIGKKAKIRVVDQGQSGWGHINFDDLRFSGPGGGGPEAFGEIKELFKPESDQITWDFETGNLKGWEVSGDAFRHQPTFGDNPRARNREPSKHQGKYWVGTFELRHRPSAPVKTQGDRPMGALVSPSFVIRHSKITFLIGGGCNLHTVYVALRVRGAASYKATGKCSETLQRVEWDVSKFIGETAQIRVVDNATGGWGHINVDDFQFIGPGE